MIFHSKLQEIIQQKHLEVEQLKNVLSEDPSHPILQILDGKISIDKRKNLKDALRKSQLSVIAEIKRKSPAKGELASITDPVSLAQNYIRGGADAISVLTDNKFFSGSLDDLQAVAVALKNKTVPILRKDFIIDRLQIAEAILAGADAILLIVAVLGENRTRGLLNEAKKLGVDALVEIHNEEELKVALNCGAEIIGINNRNLMTFNIDTDNSFQLASQIPENIIKVAESGIFEPSLAQRYFAAGLNAVLIGEALVKSADPALFINECKKHVTHIN